MDDVMYKAGDMSTDVNKILREKHVDIGVVEDLAHEIMGDFWQPYLTCDGATVLPQEATDELTITHGVIEYSDLPVITNTFLEWSLDRELSGKRAFFDQSATDTFIASALVHHGIQQNTLRFTWGPRAHSLHYTSLVGAFHGHAHCRLCQLNHLARYVPGLGLGDLETCERTFSKSNSLATTMHYTSIFHHQQAIASYFEYNNDYKVYANLSDFLYNNYKQALNIIADSRITLPKLMQDLDITHESIFEDWLTEEKTYLQSLCTEPEDGRCKWSIGKNLSILVEDLDAASSVWAVATPASLTSNKSATRQIETARCHALENYEKDLRLVQELECKLSITCRWTPEDPDWQGLVVARIFELTQMNRSGTGYKMQKHIAKALQACSATIKTALNRYNIAACALSTPHRTLKWEEVVEYAFLADFNLLRDSRNDISQCPWAIPSAHQATDLYFKTCRAREEITHLNIEVRRLATYLRDEEHYLHECQCQAEALHPVLAHQINLWRQVRSWFNSHHLQHLQDIANLPEFSGTTAPGICTFNNAGDSTSIPCVTIPARLIQSLSSSASSAQAISQSIIAPEAEEDYKEEEEDISNVEEASKVFNEVLCIATD
ncbi:hypothetical protein BDR03DRAFT_981835 [Suillus americanus]|nr:hypothetical protein BDR03DRAFT_981835 [Suillus americanus]